MTFSAVETFPPAKLNLYLELIAKRADGFHDLETVMTAIDRRDWMRVSRVEHSQVTLQCQWSRGVVGAFRQLCAAGIIRNEELRQILAIPPVESNLVYRALEQFRIRFSVECGFHVDLTKRIPAGAGMGGASSDAASALLCAAKLCGVSTSDFRIREIAASLGSDVPFFLGREDAAWGGTGNGMGDSCSAIATGRGDQLEFLKNTCRTYWVVVYPPQCLSTADVYRQSVISAELVKSDDCLAFLRGERTSRLQKLMAMVFFNRLFGPARQLSAWVDQTLSAIRDAGLCYASMTGSGSACFAFARSNIEARRAAQRLRSRRLGIVFSAASVGVPAPVRIVT